MGRQSKRGPSGRRVDNPYKKPDRFTIQAKEEGYAARSVFKLKEIQARHRVFRPGMRVVDLGCSPGSWLVYAAEQVGRSGVVVGVDIQEPTAKPGPVLVKSVLDVTSAELREALGGHGASVVLSDMAPNTTGDPTGDHFLQLELAGKARDLALELLEPGGAFVCKVFDGQDAHPFVLSLRPHFAEVKRARPEAVRKNSREFFVVATGFRGRQGSNAKVDSGGSE
jgi:23S rRNA (uridine2552-2'-O)-methyltransferase